MRVLILGAGGHAQVVADALIAANAAGLCNDVPVGFLDDDASLHGQIHLGIPVLGAIAEITAVLAADVGDAVAMGIGSNKTRQRLFDLCRADKVIVVTVIHPRAIIAGDVEVGLGTVILAGVVVNTGSTIGRNVILNTACTVDHHNRIGDHVHVAPGVHLGGDVTVGSGTLVGIGATVMPQRTIGANAVVGAGSLVRSDVLAGATVVGVPAGRILRS